MGMSTPLVVSLINSFVANSYSLFTYQPLIRSTLPSIKSQPSLRASMHTPAKGTASSRNITPAKVVANLKLPSTPMRPAEDSSSKKKSKANQETVEKTNKFNSFDKDVEVTEKMKLEALEKKTEELQGYVNQLQDAVTVSMYQLRDLKVSQGLVPPLPAKKRLFFNLRRLRKGIT
ncbi:hypothetical protein RRF57_011211 [Xylaria bambusicola]|uniref:Uncharacterized protein n=1 Tax=Xylaria bambusicola TaxID=326684 RepID=A0AAN7UW87_9PEZI